MHWIDQRRPRFAGLKQLAVVTLLLFCTILSPQATAFADDAQDDYNLAAGLYKQSRWSLAATAFQAYLKKYPKHEKVPFAKLYLGLAFVNDKKYDPARKTLRIYVNDYPKSKNLADALYRIGECSFLLDDLKSAATEFNAFLKQFPDHELAEYALPYLADAQLRLNRPQEAAAAFSKSLAQFPKGSLAEDSKFGLARAYETLKQSDRALPLYKELAENRTGNRADEAQLSMATLYFESKKYAEAATAFSDIAKRFPDSSLVITAELNAGFAYYQLGEFRQAIIRFDNVTKDKARSLTAKYWSGVSHKSLGDYPKAASLLKSAYDADPKNPLAENLLYQWADCELRQKHFEESIKLFLQVVDGWPKGEYADDSLHYAAEAAMDSGQLKQTETLLNRFEKEYPASGLRLHQALLRGRLLDTEDGKESSQKAIVQFEKVLRESKLPQTQNLARFHLARAYQKQDKHPQTLSMLVPLIAEVKKNGAQAEFTDALVLQAISLLAEKKYEQASKSVGEYLQLRPTGTHADQAIATRALSEAYRGDQTTAQFNLTLLVNKFPKSPVIAKTTHQVAEIAYAANDWAWSGKLFTSIIKQGQDSPYHAAGLAGLGWSLTQQKKYAEAAQQFNLIATQHPNHELAPEAAYMQGKSLQDAQKFPESVKAYQRAFEKYAPKKYAFLSGLQTARVLKHIDQIDQADKAYEGLLKKFPKADNLDKLFDEWALLNYEAERYDRSDEIFRRLVSETPNSDLADNARLSLAESDLLAGKLDAASATFLDLSKSKKSDDQVREVSLYRLIDIALEKGDWQQVDRSADQLQKKFPKSQYVWYGKFHLGEAKLRLNQLDAALKSFLEVKAAKDNPDVKSTEWFPRVWILLTEIYHRQKKYNDVISVVDEFRQWNPKSTFLYQADEIVGRSYKNQAKFPQALVAFKRVLDAPAGRRTETAAKSQFMIAEIYLIQKKHKEALLEYLKVQIQYKFPEWQAPALYQAALCHEALQEWPEAAKTYENLLGDYPNSEYAAKAKARLPVVRKKISG